MEKIANIVLNDFTNDNRVLKTSESLFNSGHSVEVFALGGNDRPCREEIAEGLFVTRISLLTRSLPRYKVFQIFKYLEFLLRVSCKVFSFSAIHCNDLNTLPCGVIVKLISLGRKKVVYDAHELEVGRQNLGKIEQVVAKVIEGALIPWVDVMLTVSKSISEEYKRIYNLSKLPEVILNCPRYTTIKKNNLFREMYPRIGDRKIFLYQGALTSGRGIDRLVSAFNKPEMQKFVIMFMGYGPLASELEGLARFSGNIFYHPAVAPKKLLRYTSSADYGVSLIEDTCLSYRYCLPNKLFEYLMADIPVIVSNLKEMKQFVLENKVGTVVRDTSVESMISSVKGICEHPGFDKNIQVIKKIYCWETQEVKILELYSTIR